MTSLQQRYMSRCCSETTVRISTICSIRCNSFLLTLNRKPVVPYRCINCSEMCWGCLFSQVQKTEGRPTDEYTTGQHLTLELRHILHRAPLQHRASSLVQEDRKQVWEAIIYAFPWDETSQLALKQMIIKYYAAD